VSPGGLQGRDDGRDAFNTRVWVLWAKNRPIFGV
jgi:hypothetical protein